MNQIYQSPLQRRQPSHEAHRSRSSPWSECHRWQDTHSLTHSLPSLGLRPFEAVKAYTRAWGCLAATLTASEVLLLPMLEKRTALTGLALKLEASPLVETGLPWKARS